MSFTMNLLKPTDSEFQFEIQKAIEFATKAHAGQTRKISGLPYICHPIAVLNQIADWECYDLNIWKAAVCHDVDEDTEYTLKQIEDVIGTESALLVDELTFRPTTDDPKEKSKEKAAYMKLWGQKENGEWVKSLPAFIIKVSDRIANTVDFLSTNPQYAGKYWKKAQALIDSMAGRQDEILEIYGENVWARMRYSRTCITRHLY